MDFKKTLLLSCLLLAFAAFFPSCNNDDNSSPANDFYIQGKVEGQLVNCTKVVAPASIFSSFGVTILQMSMAEEGGSGTWTFQIQSTAVPDDWTLPKTFVGDIFAFASDNVNGGGSNSNGLQYGPLDPISCGIDWEFKLIVTKWEDNILEGTFSGPMYGGDCDDTTPETLTSVDITEGKFRVKVE